ncbi:MAG: hypothetical protein AB7F31_05550 [Parachlamydiales bacterium]
MNTWGLCSINNDTFNIKQGVRYPENVRNVIVTLYRLHNLALLIGGYLPQSRLYTGCARVLSGAGMLAVTLLIGEPDALQGLIIGPYYREALNMGAAQIYRGLLEAGLLEFAIRRVGVDFGTLSPLIGGRQMNLLFDFGATPFNIYTHFDQMRSSVDTDKYPEPAYPILLWPLYLV